MRYVVLIITVACVFGCSLGTDFDRGYSAEFEPEEDGLFATWLGTVENPTLGSACLDLCEAAAFDCYSQCEPGDVTIVNCADACYEIGNAPAVVPDEICRLAEDFELEALYCFEGVEEPNNCTAACQAASSRMCQSRLSMQLDGAGEAVADQCQRACALPDFQCCLEGTLATSISEQMQGQGRVPEALCAAAQACIVQLLPEDFGEEVRELDLPEVVCGLAADAP